MNVVLSRLHNFRDHVRFIFWLVLNHTTFPSGAYLMMEIQKATSEEILSSQYPLAFKFQNMPLWNNSGKSGLLPSAHSLSLALEAKTDYILLLLWNLSTYDYLNEIIKPAMSWGNELKTMCACVHPGRMFCWHWSHFHDNTGLTALLFHLYQCNSWRRFYKTFELIYWTKPGKNVPKNVK